MRKRLQIDDPSKDTSRAMNVVVKDHHNLVSLIVDRVGDVINVHEDRYEPPPSSIRGMIRELITGVYKLEHALLISLDLPLICNMQNIKK